MYTRKIYATPLIISIYGDGDAWPQLLTNRMLWCSLLSVGTHDSYVKCDERMWGEGRGCSRSALSSPGHHLATPHIQQRVVYLAFNPAHPGLGWAELGWAGLGWAGLVRSPHQQISGPQHLNNNSTLKYLMTKYARQ